MQGIVMAPKIRGWVSLIDKRSVRILVVALISKVIRNEA